MSVNREYHDMRTVANAWITMCPKQDKAEDLNNLRLVLEKCRLRQTILNIQDQGVDDPDDLNIDSRCQRYEILEHLLLKNNKSSY